MKLMAASICTALHGYGPARFQVSGLGLWYISLIFKSFRIGHWLAVSSSRQYCLAFMEGKKNKHTKRYLLAHFFGKYGLNDET